jgi:Flp pilus assembly protein TadG
MSRNRWVWSRAPRSRTLASMHIQRRLRRGQEGQAAVEFVALLPILALIGLLLWQLVVAGQAVWLAGGAARAAARARAVGADGVAAARAALPSRLERGVPWVVGRRPLTTITARARFEPQEG